MMRSVEASQVLLRQRVPKIDEAGQLSSDFPCRQRLTRRQEGKARWERVRSMEGGGTYTRRMTGRWRRGSPSGERQLYGRRRRPQTEKRDSWVEAREFRKDACRSHGEREEVLLAVPMTSPPPPLPIAGDSQVCRWALANLQRLGVNSSVYSASTSRRKKRVILPAWSEVAGEAFKAGTADELKSHQYRFEEEMKELSYSCEMIVSLVLQGFRDYGPGLLFYRRWGKEDGYVLPFAAFHQFVRKTQINLCCKHTRDTSALLSSPSPRIWGYLWSI
ncbi:hypothetical protein HPP92_008343 [Vanilla planifolia]|uniref:Uncharacterized protein n=1 Tax=Vanilla planifolia TaxID=51239 RepID=A0A835R4J3_VANPL|nr:hypothetical protein HPP92_008343 [Vanilla planifolia]